MSIPVTYVSGLIGQKAFPNAALNPSDPIKERGSMLSVGSAFRGLAVEAIDGKVGTVSDLLFDDRKWMARWVVVDTGSDLPGCKVLIHPSAIRNLDFVRKTLSAALTKAQVERAPNLSENQPVSQRMETLLYRYYGCDPLWHGNSVGAGTEDSADLGDPHLRSAATIQSYRILTRDSDLGYLDDFMLDTEGWRIRYLIVTTKHWWTKRKRLVLPHIVHHIRWTGRHVSTRES